MKTSRACVGMLSYENDFKFLKTEQTIKSMCITCTTVPGSWNCFISPNQSVDDQKREHKCSLELHYIFSKISKFRNW